MTMFFNEKPDSDFVPGKYADDAKVGLVFLSIFFYVASLVGYVFDTTENATYLILAAVYFSLLFVAVDRDRRRR